MLRGPKSAMKLRRVRVCCSTIDHYMYHRTVAVLFKKSFAKNQSTVDQKSSLNID